jgi:hypothetical protein
MIDQLLQIQTKCQRNYEQMPSVTLNLRTESKGCLLLWVLGVRNIGSPILQEYILVKLWPPIF